MSDSCSPVIVPTNAGFRAQFPEFSDTTKYPDAGVNLWLGIAIKQLDPNRWQDLYEVGSYFFMAHNLSLGKKNQLAAIGGVPGGSGLVEEKTVGRVSVVNDTEATTIKGGGPWNLTTYGTQLLWYAQLVGSGGQQITGPFVSPFPAGNGGYVLGT